MNVAACGFESIADDDERRRWLEVLAWERCRRCGGAGRSLARSIVCGCVLRRIFRLCLDRYIGAGVLRQADRLYCADFDLSAKYTLTPRERQAFIAYFEAGEDWRLSSARLGLNRGDWWHWVYQVEQRLGRALWEREIFPLHEYFTVTGRRPWSKARSHRGRPFPMRETGETIALACNYAWGAAA